MAVSFLHEGLLELVRKRPDFVPQLLAQFLNIGVPPSAKAQLSESTLNETVPAEFHADAAVVIVVGETPMLGAIVEAQLEKRERKRYTWPHYATGGRARHECPFIVVVVAPDPLVAHWASQPIDLGYGSVFQPHVIGPERIPKVTDANEAARDLPLAGLSVTAHGHGDPTTAAKIALAVAKAAMDLHDKEQRLLYLGLIENALSEAAKEIFRMMPEAPKYFSESQRRSYSKGAAEGEAKALLKILTQRGLSVSEDQRHQINECTDLPTLDRWLDRALLVTSVEELLA